jgi:hypothetical protein
VRSSLAKAAPALAIVFSFLALCGLTGARAEELLSNGGFEDGTAGWTSDTGTLGVVCEPALVAEGDCGARFTTDTPGTSLMQHDPVAVLPGGSYTLTLFILKNDQHIQEVTSRILWYDDRGGQLRVDSGPSVVYNDRAYRPVSFGAIQAPDGAAKAKLCIRVTSDSSGAMIYVDDVHFDGPRPAPTTASTHTPAATAAPLPSSTSGPTSTPAPSPTSTVVPTPTPPAMPTGCLLNGGFEEANGAVLVGWEDYGGGLQQTATHRRSGSFAAAYTSDSESTKWAYQAVHVQPDLAYMFDGYVLLDDPGVKEVFLRVSWYASDDASGSAVASVDSPERLTGNDPSFRYLTTGAMLVPLGVRSAKVRVMLAPLSSARATIYLDDMSLYQAPPAMPVSPPVPSIPAPEAPAEGPAPNGPPAAAERFSEVLSRAAATERSPYQVKINEVLYNAALSGDQAGSEWLELYNAGAEPVELADWTISDNGAGDRLPPLTLPPAGFVVLAGSEAFRSANPVFDGSLLVLDDGKIGNGLADKGDRLTLRDSDGRLADALSYGEDSTVLSPPVSGVAAGHSLERSPAGHDTDSAADFVDNPRPSPGTGLRRTAVLSATALGPSDDDETGPAAESSQSAHSSGVSAWLWALIGAGLFALGAGLGGGGVLYRRRLASGR